jgi:hypothetical protein
VKGHEPACIHDHVRPYLRDPRPTGPDGYRAIAPCHDDTDRSLTISKGAGGRVTWCCHACMARLGKDLMLARTRRALIDAGVPELCLPRPAAEARDLEAMITGIVFGGGSRAHGWLRIAALLRGYDDLPKGDELEALAGECGVSMRSAYDAARAAGDPTTGTEHGDQGVVKRRRSA